MFCLSKYFLLKCFENKTDYLFHVNDKSYLFYNDTKKKKYV